MNIKGFPAALVHANALDTASLLELVALRLGKAPGYTLFTLSIPQPAGTFLERIYTSDPAAYPLGQADRVKRSPWFDQLLCRKLPIVANSKEEIAFWLPEFQGFEGTEYGALINYPVVVADAAIGILNLAGRQGHFPAEAGAMIKPELALAAMAIGSFCATQRPHSGN